MYNNYSQNSAYKRVIDTLTNVSKQIIKPKYYKLDLPKYVDIEEGQGGLSDSVINFVANDVVGEFEQGNFGSGAEYEREASADVTIDDKRFYRQMWKKKVTYTIPDIEQAKKADIINLVEAKEKARKTNWDLGIQEKLFLGSKMNTKITGLLNNAEVNVDNTVLTKKISVMTDAEFNAFVSSLAEVFYMNSNKTAMFTHFIIPTDDWFALGRLASVTFPGLTRADVLQNELNRQCRKWNGKDCVIDSVAYCDKSVNGLGYDIYCLYNKDPDVLVYDLPKDYEAKPFYTLDGLNYSNTAWGMYGGVCVYRPLEMLYLTL